MAKVRLNMELSQDAASMLDDLALREGVSRGEIVRRGLLVMRAFREQMAVGRKHMGFASSCDGIEVELVGVLTPR